MKTNNNIETRVYMILVDDTGSDDYTDEEFIKLAEEQGTVFTLKGFQDFYNYEDFDSQNYYIRFIQHIINQTK